MKDTDFEKAETLKKAIREQRDFIPNLGRVLETAYTPEGLVEVRIKGTKFFLPKKIFEAELAKLIQAEEKKLTEMEEEFGKL